jgi:putative transferase (TIGR04331 family)
MLDLIAARQIEVQSIISTKRSLNFEPTNWNGQLKNSREMFELYHGIEFNKWLYHLVAEQLTHDFPSTPQMEVNSPGSLNSRVYDCTSDLAEPGDSILLGNSVERFLHLKIAIKSRSMPKKIKCRISGIESVDHKLRSRLVENLHPTSKWEHDFFTILSKTVPISYLENFDLYKNEALRFHPKKKTKIISNVEVIYDDFYKFVSAYGRSIYRSIVIGQQHGGAYGTSRIHRSSEIEARCADLWLSWGKWGFANSATVKSAHLKKFIRKTQRTCGRDILVVLNDYPRHTYWLYDCPQGSGVAEWFVFWGELINTFGTIKHWNFRIRSFPSDTNGWEHQKYFSRAAESHHSITIDAERKINKSLESAALVVTSTNGTLWLEALAANIPVIALLPEKWWPLNNNFSSLFDQMIESGLIKKEPDELVQLLSTSQHANISLWWNSAKTQSARIDFLETFAKL